MIRIMKSICFILSFLITSVEVAGQSFEVPLPARVITRSLERIPSRPFSITSDTVFISEKPSSPKFEHPLNDVLAIVIGPANSRSINSRWRSEITQSGERETRLQSEACFVDGQILPGTLEFEGERVTWNSIQLGRYPITLEDISWIRFKKNVRVPVAEAEDIVVLTNGDRIVGLVTEIADPLPIERSDGESVVNVPLNRVAALSLVNPEVPPSGLRIWTSEGSVFSAKKILVDEEGYVTVESPSLSSKKEISFPVRKLRGILMNPEELLPLSKISPQVDSGLATGIRSWTPPPVVAKGFWPMGAATIDFYGPMRARWSLPEAGVIFSAIAELPIDSNRGDFDLVIRDGGREVFRTRINSENPICPIRVRLDSSDLELEMEMANGGPIQDSLHLHEAVLMLPSAEKSGDN